MASSSGLADEMSFASAACLNWPQTDRGTALVALSCAVVSDYLSDTVTEKPENELMPMKAVENTFKSHSYRSGLTVFTCFLMTMY